VAPRRKKTPPPSGREFTIRLPEDIANRIRAKAEREIKPQNRIIINELAAYPRLEILEDVSTLASFMKNLYADYSSRIAWLDLSKDLLNAVDAVLKADGASALQAAVDKLRIQRNAMLQHQKANP
jgi:hypothetical protein